MKFSSATVALALALTAAPSAAQDITSLLSAVPACAQPCGLEAFTASPCYTDQTITCLCTNLASIQAGVGACLQKSGACPPEALAQLEQLGPTVCKTPSSSDTTSTKTATSTSTTTATVSETKDAASTTSSAAATPASNATVTSAKPPTFTGGATNVAATIGSVVLMAAVALVL